MSKERLFYGCRVLVGLFFIVSAVLKFFSIDAFELYVFGLEIFSLNVSFFFVRLLLAFEFSMGVALLSNQYRRLVDFLAYGILAVFSVFLIVQIANGYSGNCQCMGDSIDVPPATSLLKNIILALLLFASSRGCRFSLKYAQWWLPLQAVVVIAFIFIISPPDTFAQERKMDVHKDGLERFVAQNPQIQQAFKRQPTVMLCLFSTTCHVCQFSAKKMQLLADKYKVPHDCIFELFVGSDVQRRKFYTKSHSQQYPFVLLSPEAFWSMTRAVPVFVIYRNGKMTDQFSYRTLSEERIKGLVSASPRK